MSLSRWTFVAGSIGEPLWSNTDSAASEMAGAEPDRRATIAEIATSFAVSEHHLTKVVHFLGTKGWLANVRGKVCGLALGQLPELVAVGRVVRETEGESVIAECFGEADSKCCIAPVCRLRGVLGEAVDAFYTVLARDTLADRVSNRKQLHAILFADREAVKITTRSASR